jgi:carboxymethylenebutenolidase
MILAAAETPQGALVNFTTDLTSKDGFVLPAYVSLPERKPRGSVVVLQEIFGVNAHIRAVADGYAKAGYLAVAPATFHRVRAGVDLGYTPEDMQAGVALKAAIEAMASPGGDPITPLVMHDVQAAINYAATAGKMATEDTAIVGAKGGNVGVVGYCWGGLLTWRAACMLQGVSAAVPYYGGGMTVGAEAARKPKCPVMCHFGDQDKHITLPTVQAFAAAQKDVEVKIYAADHGFNCDHRGSYNAAAAELALERTLDFFSTYLR